MLKFTLNAENFTCRLSRSISSHFGAILFAFEMRVAARNREKFIKTLHFGVSRSFKVIDVDISKKLVASACYDKQHVCAYLQPFSR